MGVEKYLPTIQKNISLKNHTTFRIGGPAKYFFVAKTKEDLITALRMARKLKLSFFILGGGSNLLVGDEGYNGLIIKVQSSKFKIQKENSKFKIFCEAGTPISKLVSQSLKVSAAGLEWAAGIPGTVGGGIYGNAGAFGHSLAEIVKKVEVYDLKNEKIKILQNKDCKFSYRESIFKKNKDLIILSAEFQLKKGDKKEIQKKLKENLNRKNKTQPLNFPSAGSIFKNPPNFFAGELIEKCGLKGKRVGGVKISEKHANFIVNLGKGKARDVKKLISLIKKKVKNKFGIKLEEEICYLGFKN